MNKTSVSAIPLPKGLTHNLKLLLPAMALFVVLMSINLWRAYKADHPNLLDNGVPISAEIEERFGVRITGLHLLARDGLVDLRYRVVDAGKAKNFGHYTETSPIILADGGGTVEVTIMGLHNHRVEAGRIYYILYRNTGDVLDKGDKVTIGIGDLYLEDVPVQ